MINLTKDQLQVQVSMFISSYVLCFTMGRINITDPEIAEIRKDSCELMLSLGEKYGYDANVIQELLDEMNEVVDKTIEETDKKSKSQWN